MKREKMTPKVDEQVFRRTAVKSKRINLGVMAMRGGIRF